MTRILSFFLATLPLLATTQVLDIRPGITGAIIHVRTDQGGICTYVVSESSSLSPVVNDVNTVLFPGSNTDGRTGALQSPPVIIGQDHWFTAGTPVVAIAANGTNQSRALVANVGGFGVHYGSVTCGMDAAVSFHFATKPMQPGRTRSRAPQFLSGALGNYGVQTIDFTNPGARYVDPETGYPYYFATGPGQVPATAFALTPQLSSTYGPGAVQGEILTNTNWTNPNNALTVGGSTASYTASAQDVLTIRFASTLGPGNISNGNPTWESTLGGVGFASSSIDTYQSLFVCDGGGSAINSDIAFTFNGVTQGGEWQEQACTSSKTTIKYPAAFNASGLAAWQSANYPTIPAVLWQVAQSNLMVTTNGTAVTATSGLFNLDSRILTAGSKITINSVEYVLASVNDAQHVTLTTSAGTQATPVAAYAFNFGLMIRKHSATSGTLNVYGPTVNIAASANFNNGGSGDVTQCSANTWTDSGGNTGRFCILYNTAYAQAGGAIYAVMNNYTTRYIGNAVMPAGGFGTDAYAAQGYTGQGFFDATDPNSWWVPTNYTSGTYAGTITLNKATYHPAGGVGGCSATANYQPIPLDPNYTWSNMSNCNITYTELTLQSIGNAIWGSATLPAALTSGRFAPLNSSSWDFSQGGSAVLQACPTGALGCQNKESWFVIVSLSTGAVTGAFSTYMNTTATTGSYPCRGCELHSPVSGDVFSNWFGFSTEFYYDGGSQNGAGPYYLESTTALTTTPAYTPSQCSSMFSIPAETAWMVPYSSGCDEITFVGSDSIACNPAPSAWETANAPACSWTQTAVPSGSRQWQAGTLIGGEWIKDPTDAGYDYMMPVLKISGSTWLTLRAVNPPHGTEMIVNSFSMPIAHALAGTPSAWTAAIVCNMNGNPFISVSEVNGSGILWDRWWSLGHGSMRNAGLGGNAVFPDAPSSLTYNGLAVRLGTLPGAANTPNTSRMFYAAQFGGQSGLVTGSAYVQSHPGYGGVVGSNSLQDFAPMVNGGGGYALWAQTAPTNVTGSLYKIPVANAIFPPAERFLPQTFWTGGHNFLDASGTACDGTSAGHYKFWVVRYAADTCGQSGTSVGDVFFNSPGQMTLDGSTGGIFDYNRPSSTPLGMETNAVMQYVFGANTPPTNENNNGADEMRVTTAAGINNAQEAYANSKILPGSSILMFNCSLPNLQRIEDVCIGPAPVAPPLDTIYRGTYIPATSTIGASGPASLTLSWGYPFYGGYCTQAQEQCNASTLASPFVWAGESQNPYSCGGGCAVTVQCISGEIYFPSQNGAAKMPEVCP